MSRIKFPTKSKFRIFRILKIDKITTPYNIVFNLFIYLSNHVITLNAVKLCKSSRPIFLTTTFVFILTQQ